MSLKIRCIDNARDFMALASTWYRLVNDSGQTSPFLSYDWFWCCWHGVWPQRRPEVLVVEEGGTPLAIVPLMHWRAWVHGLPIRYVSFLECPFTPLVDVVIADQHDRVIEICLDHLRARSDWDIAWLQKLPSISPTLKALEAMLPRRFLWHRAGHLLCPYVGIDGAWDNFVGTKGPSFKEPYQKIQVQLESIRDVSLEEHRNIDLQSTLLQEALAEMSRNRQTDGGVSIATMPRTSEFFRELTRRAAKNGWLSLCLLRLNGHVISIEYQLRSNGIVQALWARDDPAYRALLPRQTLRLAMLQSLFEGNYVYEYSSEPGVEDDGLWWANGSHEMVHLKFYRPGLYSRFLQRLETSRVSETQ